MDLSLKLIAAKKYAEAVSRQTYDVIVGTVISWVCSIPE